MDGSNHNYISPANYSSVVHHRHFYPIHQHGGQGHRNTGGFAAGDVFYRSAASAFATVAPPADVAAATSALAVVNLLVVCGNCFVLYILVSQKALHTSTNFIVLSLTISDFLLGVLILPFSILQEYSMSWMFGAWACELWLALDVLLSTASIYNLLAISFDRYMAVKQPIKYRYISSNRMTKITIAIVWTIASTLALPPLLLDHFGMSASLSAAPLPTVLSSSGRGRPSRASHNFVRLTTAGTAVTTGTGLCTPITSSNWYILFSAFVSFVLPMFLMILLNFSIFYTVSDSTKLTKLPAASKHFAHTVTAVAVATSTDDVDSLLRIHRGGRFYKHSSAMSRSDMLTGSQRSLSLVKSSLVGMSAETKARNSSLSGSLAGAGRGASIDSTTASVISAAKRATSAFERHGTFSYSLDSSTLASSEGGGPHYSKPTSAKLSWLNRIKAINRERHLIEAERQSIQSNGSVSTYPYPIGSPPLCQSAFANAAPSQSESKPSETAVSRPPRYIKMEQASVSSANDRLPLMTVIERSAADQSVWYPAVVTTLLAGASCKSTKASTSGGLFLYPMLNQHHQQMSRGSVLRTELRVARTIAVVVGCFVVCWLPFAVIYLLQAFRTCPVGECVPTSAFTFAFWLGYSNSALNPLLYAAFSRDFRTAFRKVLMDRTSSFRSNC